MERRKMKKNKKNGKRETESARGETAIVESRDGAQGVGIPTGNN